MIARRRALAVALLVAAAACATPSTARDLGRAPASGRLTWREVRELQESRDYFTLRDRLAVATDTTSPPARFARAVVQHAFNQPAASDSTIAALLATTAGASLPETLVAALRRVQLDDDVRLFRYVDGRAAADSLLAHPDALDSAALRDVANTRRMMAALAGTPPQEVERLGPTSVHLDQGRVPVVVNDSLRHYIFDTGANLSTVMRSEAAALGMRIIPAGLDVGTSTEHRVRADLAVADSLTIGGLRWRHVVFLVLDDSLLSMPDGFRVLGIIGFPVIEQMGEIRIGRDGTLVAPVTPPFRPQQNLALDELTPLVRVRWNGAPLLCRLDTGADRTVFYEPFYRRNAQWIDRVARRTTHRMGGAGGVSALSVFVLPTMRLSLGDTVAVLDSVDVLPRSIVRTAEENFLDCNIGDDVFDAFGHYVLNFHDMAFLLR